MKIDMKIGTLMERRLLLNVTPGVHRCATRIAWALWQSRSRLDQRTFALRDRVGSQVRG